MDKSERAASFRDRRPTEDWKLESWGNLATQHSRDYFRGPSRGATLDASL